MKTKDSLFVVILMVSASFFMLSCGGSDDDDNGDDGKYTSSMFVGSWVDSSGDHKWVLNSGGKCDYYVLEGSGSGKNITFSLKLNSSGTWKFNESTQVLSMKTSKVGLDYTIVDVTNNSWTCRTGTGNYSTWIRD